MKTETYHTTAYRPDRIPRQQPSAERSWLGKFAKMRLPWGNTQELAPAKFFHQDTPEDLRLGEQIRAEDETKKANGTYEPRITEIVDFHYVYDHKRLRFAQLAMVGRFWTNLYAFGKWGFIWLIIPAAFAYIVDLSTSNEPWLEVTRESFIAFYSWFLGIPLSMWVIGGLVVYKLPRLWVKPSRGPLWEFNRQTGMVTVFDYDNNGEYKKNGTIGELTAPFHEFDAYLSSSPDRQGLPMNLLHLAHRYRDIHFTLAPILHQSDDANEHFALWDYLQNYMDVSRPLPDIPYLEQYRHLDPTTAEHDQRTGRNPRYWIDMDDATFKTKVDELLTDICRIDTLRRPNLMAKHVEYVD